MFRVLGSAALSLGLIAGPAAAAVVYAEDFAGQNGKGIFGGTDDQTGVTWSVSAPGVLDGDSAGVVDEAFRFNDVNDEAVWLSPLLDISGFTGLSLGIDFAETGDHEGPGCNCGINIDYLNVEAIVGGFGTVFYDNINGFGTDGTYSLTGDIPNDGDFLSTSLFDTVPDGSTLQIRISARNTAGSEFLSFDNVEVLGTEIAAVPVGASGLMLLSVLGGLGVGALRKRRG